MRFLLVVTIWLVIVGGLWSYIDHRDQNRREQVIAAVPVDLSVEARFAIEITPTFSAEEDPFALTTTDTSAPLLEVKLNGSEIDLDAEEVLRGKTIRQENVKGVLSGHNEIYVAASPPLAESTLEHGIRVKLFDDSGLLVDQTVWAENGAVVSGTVTFSHFQNEVESHDH
jgi:hypothetical protein